MTTINTGCLTSPLKTFSESECQGLTAYLTTTLGALTMTARTNTIAARAISSIFIFVKLQSLSYIFPASLSDIGIKEQDDIFHCSIPECWSGFSCWYFDLNIRWRMGPVNSGHMPQNSHADLGARLLPPLSDNSKRLRITFVTYRDATKYLFHS